MSYPESYDDHQDYLRQEELRQRFERDYLLSHNTAGNTLTDPQDKAKDNGQPNQHLPE